MDFSVFAQRLMLMLMKQCRGLVTMFPLFPFLLSKTLLYWVDISANFACAAHTHKKCAACSFNMLFIFDLTLDYAQFRLPEK